MKNNQLQNIQQIINYIDTIFAYLDSNNVITQDDFENNKMLLEACIFNLSQIGEKVNKISKDIQERNNDIP